MASGDRELVAAAADRRPPREPAVTATAQPSSSPISRTSAASGVLARLDLAARELPPAGGLGGAVRRAASTRPVPDDRGADDGSHGRDASEPPPGADAALRWCPCPRRPPPTSSRACTCPAPRRTSPRSTRSRTLLGGRVGVDAVLDDLNRRGRRTWAPGPGRAPRADLGPRGPAYPPVVAAGHLHLGRRLRHRGHRGTPGGRDDVVRQGAPRRGPPRVAADVPRPATRGATATCCSWCRRSPRTATLRLEPLEVHAGGHRRGTARTCTSRPPRRGFFTCRVDDLLRVPDERASGDRTRLGVDGDQVSSYGYRYLLPVRFAYEAAADDGPRAAALLLPLARPRHDAARSWSPGEYGRGDARPGGWPASRSTRRRCSSSTGEDGLSPAAAARRRRGRPDAGRGGGRAGATT